MMFLLIVLIAYALFMGAVTWDLYKYWKHYETKTVGTSES